MARYCFHCKAQIRADDLYCPYCSANQQSPGDPFIGFLLFKWKRILLIAVLLFLMFFLMITLPIAIRMVSLYSMY